MTFNLYPLPPLSHGPHPFPLSLCLYPFRNPPRPRVTITGSLSFPPRFLVDPTFIPYPFAFILSPLSFPPRFLVDPTFIPYPFAFILSPLSFPSPPTITTHEHEHDL